MIPRYTRSEMGHIWSDANKYQCWLTVEVAASQALASFGLVPQSAADAIRDKGAFTVDRINEIEAEVRHDVIAFTTTVAEHINSPEALPLAPLRPYQHRRRRHRAVPPAQRSLRHHPLGHRRPLRNPQAPRNRVQAHPHRRPHPRHPRRTLHLRPQAAPLVLRDAA